MSTWLVLRLYGPMASWGEAAVGEFRSTSDHPTRTAVLGIVAAALGIERDQEVRLLSLDRAMGVAVMVERSGALLRDYHTAQVPSSRRGLLATSRRRELMEDNLNTVLSSRDYRVDALYRVCLWWKGSADWSLEALARALERPVFAPYLGRRSCPLAIPMSPRVVEAESLADALTGAELPPLPEPFERLTRKERPRPGETGNGDGSAIPGMRVYWEGEVPSGLVMHQTAPRSDALLSRRRHQFGRRDEHLGYLPLAADKEG